MGNFASWKTEDDIVIQFIEELKEEMKKGNNDFFRMMYVFNSDLRKKIHEFAQINGLYHVSYRDIDKESEHKSSYYCSHCEKWIRSNGYEEMSDERELLVLCKNCEEIIADESGQYDSDCDKQPKYYYTNNVIAVSNNIDLLSRIFKAKGIKKPKEWIRKRHSKFPHIRTIKLEQISEKCSKFKSREPRLHL